MANPPNHPNPQDPYGRSDQPYGGQQPGQPYGGQQQPGQPYGGQQQPGQPYGGQQPNQPYGGQQQPGQPYGGQQPNHPYGDQQPGQPFGGQQPGGFPPAPTPPKKSVGRNLLVALGTLVVIAVVIGAVLFGLSLFKGDDVSDASDVAVGDCVTVHKEEGTNLGAKDATCGTTDFHYIVVDKVESLLGCGDSYSALSFFGGKGDGNKVLCLAPVYQQGKCYFQPTARSGTALAEFREIGCAERPAAGTVLRVESKSPGEPKCPAPQQFLFLDKPTPTGYCITVQE